MSACKKKKLCKVLLMQLQLLVECMEKNPALVSRSSCKYDKKSKDQMHWEEVAAILNAYPNGVKKSPSEWRKFWNKKITAVRRNVTEQKIQNAEKKLNPFEARVWKIIAEADKISQDHNMPASPAKTIKLEPDIDDTQSPNKTTKYEEDFRFTIQIKPKEPISQSCSTAEDIQHSNGVLWEIKQEKIDVPQSPPASTEPISQSCSTAENIQHLTGIWELKQEEIDVPQSPPAATEPINSESCSTVEDIQHSTGIWEIKQEKIDVPQSPPVATEPIYSKSCSTAEDIQHSTGIWELKQKEIDIPSAFPASDETDSATSDNVPAWASDLQRRWIEAEERQVLALERLAASMGTITKAVNALAANTVNTQQLAARIEMLMQSPNS